MDGDPEDFATLIAFQTIGEAQVAAGLLKSAGIDCSVADEMIATAAPHWGPAMGGYRLQVRRVDIDRARATLADESHDEPDPVLPPGFVDPDDPRPNPREDAALRAWRAAIVGWILLPILFHVYSLGLLATVLRRTETLTPRAQRRAIGAAILDVTALAGGALLVDYFWL
jgi:hypothetical protein